MKSLIIYKQTMHWLAIVSLAAYLLPATSIRAAEQTSQTNNAASLPAELLDLNQATQRLNQIFFTPNKIDVGDIGVSVVQAKNIIEKHIANGFNQLEASRQAMYDLGMKAAECSKACANKRALIQEVNRRINRDSGTATVLLAGDEGPNVIALFDDIIRPNCSAVASEQCARATTTATDLWHIAGQYRAFPNQLNTQDVMASKQSLRELDQMWRSYKDDTIKLWPQEVLLSSLLFRQNQDGFTAPPNYKVLALRPALGLSYLSAGSPDLRPTLNLDLLGLYWWDYKDSKATKGRGLAASLVWAGDDTAYGLTYHHNPRWSATIASSNENDLVLSVSFQLGFALLR